MEVERHDLAMHSELAQVILNDSGCFGALGIGGARKNGEFHGTSVRIQERSVWLPGETAALQQLAGMLDGGRQARQGRIHPKFISRRDLTPQRSGPSTIDESDDRVAINSIGYCLPEAHVIKPRLL